MIRLLFFFLCVSMYSFSYSQIHFITSLNEAKKISKENDKHIFVEVGANWCMPCKKMESQVFSDLSLASIFNEHFVNLKIDGDKEITFRNNYQIRAYPTMLILDKKGNKIQEHAGYMTKTQLYKFVNRYLPSGFFSVEHAMIDMNKQTDDTIMDFFTQVYNSGGGVFLNDLVNLYLEENGIESDVKKALFIKALPNVTPRNFQAFFSKNSVKKYPLEIKELFCQTAYEISNHDENFAIQKAFGLTESEKNKMKVYLNVYKKYSKSNIICLSQNEDATEECALLLNYPEVHDENTFRLALSEILFTGNNPILLQAVYDSYASFVQLNPTINHYDYLSLIQYKIGKEDEALKSIQHALQLAEEKNQRYKASLSSIKNDIRKVELN